jgi:hypothetical protein
MKAGRSVWWPSWNALCMTSEGLTYLVSARNWGTLTRHGRILSKLFEMKSLVD